MGERKLFAVEEDDGKCGGCNWRVDKLYAYATSKEEAQALYESGNAGLCGDCMCELIIDIGATLVGERW